MRSLKSTKTHNPTTLDLREILKKVIQSELENLPKTLSELDPKERILVVTRLMPFVFPKVEAVHHSDGEPLTWP